MRRTVRVRISVSMEKVKVRWCVCAALVGDYGQQGGHTTGMVDELCVAPHPVGVSVDAMLACVAKAASCGQRVCGRTGQVDNR